MFRSVKSHPNVPLPDYNRIVGELKDIAFTKADVCHYIIVMTIIIIIIIITLIRLIEYTIDI